MLTSRLARLLYNGILILITTSASAALHDRGSGLIYDDISNITWIADANLAASNTFGVAGINPSGAMSWYTAQNWVAAMNLASYLGYDNWRMPITLDPDSSCTDDIEGTIPSLDPTGVNCIGSEMGHLFYNELGGTAGTYILTSNDPDLALFSNIQENLYWSETEYAPSPVNGAWHFHFDSGFQNTFNKGAALFVWVVHDGDVAMADSDGDSIPDNDDNCPTIANATQADKDNNNVGDACEPPRVTGIWTSGDVSVGEAISLFVFGDYFDLSPNATQVFVSENQQFLVQVVTTEMLIVRITVSPVMIGGPVTVSTTNGSATSSTNFGDILNDVNITGLWPAVVSAGDFVFMFGSGYAIPLTASIGAAPVPLIQVVSEELSILVVPPEATTGPVTVTSPLGTATSSIGLTIAP